MKEGRIDRKAVRGCGLIGKQIEEKHEREVNEFLAFMLKEKLSRDFTLCGEEPNWMKSSYTILSVYIAG